MSDESFFVTRVEVFSTVTQCLLVLEPLLFLGSVRTIERWKGDQEDNCDSGALCAKHRQRDVFGFQTISTEGRVHIPMWFTQGLSLGDMACIYFPCSAVDAYQGKRVLEVTSIATKITFSNAIFILRLWYPYATLLRPRGGDPAQ